MNARQLRFLLAALALTAIVAVPVFAGANPSAPGQQKDKDKVPSAPITLTGTIRSATDAEGETTYTLASGGTTYTLDAGPSWFFGDNHPLKPHVGKSVTIAGDVKEGSTEVDVKSVNGTALRAEGKPPWAGGWKRVGKLHPGWSQEKADRFEAKFGAKFGDCWPPGHCKDKTKDKAAEPDESAAP